MAENMGRKRPTGLRLIRGGRNEIRFGPLQLIVAPPEAPPFAPAATVLEEDTWLVLSAEPTVKPVADNMVRLMTDLLTAKPTSPGSVLVANGEPMQILAVVYDLSEEPLCRPEWVGAALRGIFTLAEEKRLTKLAMPLLGVRYGRLPLSRFAELLTEVVRETTLLTLQQVWLTVADVECREVRRLLTALAKKSGLERDLR